MALFSCWLTVGSQGYQMITRPKLPAAVRRSLDARRAILAYLPASGAPIHVQMVSNILGFIGMVVAIVGFVLVRQMLVRRIPRAVMASRVGQNRVVQYVALGVVVLVLCSALGVVSVVFVGLFLVVGTVLKVISLINPTPPQPGATPAPLAAFRRQAD